MTSNQVRTHKLAAMQQRREIHVLRQEKKHLQGVLAKMEADVEDLEEGKVLAETKHLLADMPAARGGATGAGGAGGAAGASGADDYRRLRGDLLSFDDDDEDGFGERKSAPAPGHSGSGGDGGGDGGRSGGAAQKKPSVYGSADLTPYDDKADAGDPEALVQLLKQRQGELQRAEAGWSAEKQRADRLQSQVSPVPRAARTPQLPHCLLASDTSTHLTLRPTHTHTRLDGRARGHRAGHGRAGPALRGPPPGSLPHPPRASPLALSLRSGTTRT